MLFLNYFTPYWQAQLSSTSLQLTQLHSFYGWVIVHCIYVPPLLYPFFCQWTSRLLLCPGYWLSTWPMTTQLVKSKVVIQSLWPDQCPCSWWRPHWFSGWDCWTCSSSTLELLRKADFWAQCQTHWIRNSGDGTAIRALTNPPDDSDTQLWEALRVQSLHVTGIFKGHSAKKRWESESVRSLSHVWLFVMSDFLTPWTSATRRLCPWSSPGKNTAVGCHFFLQGIFPTQGSNPGLSRCRQTLHVLSHLGSPKETKQGLKHRLPVV